MDWPTSRRALLLGGTLLGLSHSSSESQSGGNGTAVRLRDFGADPTGQTSAVEAFDRALAAGGLIEGTVGDVYLLDRSVTVPPGRTLVGNGAALRLAPKVIGLRLAHDHCRVAHWTFNGNGGLYAVLNTGKHNEFSHNLCMGDIGHFFFSTTAEHVLATGNRIDGASASKEITTGLVAENSRYVRLIGNAFFDIPIGWGIQIRDGSRDFTIADNDFRQTRWSDDKAAQAGQRVFAFTLGAVCHLKKIQINGKPLSVGYTIGGSGPTYTVTFASGRAAGEVVSLVGYRGAENIQINTGASFGTISGNRIDGTGDSGIVCLGSHLNVTNNDIRNCGYAGVAIYGGQDHILVSGNTIADCAQLDDALSSPDNPRQASVFAGAILASGDDATITDNIISNAARTMRYGIRINKTDMRLRTDGSASIIISRNRFEGAFADGHVFAPNETSGERVNSIAVDGARVDYPGRIELDAAWTNAPPGGRYIRTSGFGRTWAVRDTQVTRRAGSASLLTVPHEYVDFSLSGATLLRDCNVAVAFWAKAERGRSYVSVFTVLEGLSLPLTAAITSTEWQRYEIRFPLTANLDDVILIRCGADDGSAHIQDIEISARRL